MAAAIESVLAQTHGDFELLIADDGSSDGSAKIAEEYAARDKRIRYWKNKNRQGLFGNYNACIKEARGKYIKPFAQDDVLLPDSLKTMSAILDNESNIVLVSSSRQIIDDAGQITELKQPIKQDMRASGKEVIAFHLIGLNNWVGEPSTVMYRAEFAGDGFDRSYYHYGDIEYWFRILMHGDFCYLQQPLANFRRHAASQTDKNHREMYFALDILRMSLDYRHVLADIESEDLLKRRLAEKIALEHSHVVDAAKPESLFAEYGKAFLNAGKDISASALNNAAESSNSAGLSNAAAPNNGAALSDAEVMQLKSQAAGFRLLASLSLNTISQLISELDHEKRCRHDEHERFVVEVNKMRQSLYWKLSTPLRKVRNAIKGES